jgi:nicotinamidase-related amidase
MNAEKPNNITEPINTTTKNTPNPISNIPSNTTPENTPNPISNIPSNTTPSTPNTTPSTPNTTSNVIEENDTNTEENVNTEEGMNESEEGMNNMNESHGENVDNMKEGASVLHRIPEIEIGERIKKTALIVVNIQNCFFRGGSFAMYPEKDIIDDVTKEKDLIRKINQLIGLFEEDIDYFNASLVGSPAIMDSLNEVTDFNTGLKYFEGSYPTGTRKKYVFDHIVYTQTAYPPDHPSFASYHYLREKKNKIKELITTQNMSYQDALSKVTDDSVDKHFWSYVDPNFANTGMNQFDGENKLYPDHALIDGSDTIIENQRCYRGVEFHPRLNIAPLYRPNININQDVYIKPPVIDGRGKIMWLGADNESYPRSAFMDTNMKSTGLAEHLKEKGVEKIFVVGMFRDIMVESTLIDALSSGFEDVTLIYDATLPYGFSNNETKVNNYLYFKNQMDIIKYLEKIESDEEDSKFNEYLKENNPWVLNLESQNIKVINGYNLMESIKVGKEEFSCGFYPDGLIKNFDVFFKTSTSTSRNQ